MRGAESVVTPMFRRYHSALCVSHAACHSASLHELIYHHPHPYFGLWPCRMTCIWWPAACHPSTTRAPPREDECTGMEKETADMRRVGLLTPWEAWLALVSAACPWQTWLSLTEGRSLSLYPPPAIALLFSSAQESALTYIAQLSSLPGVGFGAWTYRDSVSYGKACHCVQLCHLKICNLSACCALLLCDPSISIAKGMPSASEAF